MTAGDPTTDPATDPTSPSTENSTDNSTEDPTKEPTVTVGPLYLADAPGCAALERILFAGDDPWSAQAFRDSVRSGQYYLAARDGDRLVGYAGIAVVAGPPEPEAEIHTIGVHPDQQGSGVGRRLLAALLEHADAMGATVYLEVRTDNEPAQALYRATGFEVVGLRRSYYRPSGADAFTMRRPAVRTGE